MTSNKSDGNSSAPNFTTLLGRRHPQGFHQRTGPHTGLSLAEEPESRSNVLSGKVLQRLSFSSPPSWLISFTWIYVIRPGVTSPETTRSLALGNFLLSLSLFFIILYFFTPGLNLTNLRLFLGRVEGRKDPEDFPRIRTA
jgi:hypothetical protein